MSLSSEMQRVAPDYRYALLALPGGDLPELSCEANKYLIAPENLTIGRLEEAVCQAAEVASFHFDTGMEESARVAKAAKRHALFLKSAKAKDGTMLFFMADEKVYGYARVLPVTRRQFQSYLDRYDPPESGFDTCDPALLETGDAVIYRQALVLPELKGVTGTNKHYLQQAAMMRLMAGFLTPSNVNKGVDLYFTTFHQYALNFASEQGAVEIGKNPDAHEIFHVRIGMDAPENSFGKNVALRVLDGHAPLKLVAEHDRRGPA